MQAMRRYLRLMTLHGADPMLVNVVPDVMASEPRQRLVSADERAAIMSQAPLDLRLHLLFCGDLGLRSGTSVRVAAEHWCKETGELRINGIKHGGAIVTPVTRELSDTLQMCARLHPFASALRYGDRARPKRTPTASAVPRWNRLDSKFRKICHRLGIENLRVHDFRRTLAERVYNATGGDLRAVQGALGHSRLSSSAHYLQRTAMRPNLELLERIKA